jgi:hypothetical protein
MPDGVPKGIEANAGATTRDIRIYGMNALFTDYENQSAEYKVDCRVERRSESPQRQANRPIGRRRGKAPAQFNGIHRRRTKKIRW